MMSTLFRDAVGLGDARTVAQCTRRLLEGNRPCEGLMRRYRLLLSARSQSRFDGKKDWRCDRNSAPAPDRRRDNNADHPSPSVEHRTAADSGQCGNIIWE